MSEAKPISILTLLTPYAIVVCALYLFGYWSSFGINILEFMSLSDIIRLGIYPIAVGTLGIGAAFIIGIIGGIIFPAKEFQGTVEQAATVNRMHRIVKIIIIVGISLIAGLKMLKDSPDFWLWWASVMTLILILVIKDFKMLEPIIPTAGVRGIMLAIGIGALLFSFGVGKANARKVLDGKSVQVVSTKIFKEYGTDKFISKGLLEGQDTLKFVGAAGDYFIFVTLDNSAIYVVKYSDLDFLELRTLP